MAKELKPISAEALALFTAGSKGATEYKSYLDELRSKAESEVKAEFPNMALREQVAAADVRYVTKKRDAKAELRTLLSAL